MIPHAGRGSMRGASPRRVADGDVLDPLVRPQCSLAVQLRRASGAVIGRSAELAAISQELRGGVRPPRRGHARGRARHRQDAPPARAAELGVSERLHLRRGHGRRGDPRAVPRRAQPVRVGRDPRHGRGHAGGGRPSGASSTPSPAATSPASRACRPTRSSSGRSTSPASRSRRSSTIRPIALLIDDVQWADDDTLRLLRYVVRSDADRPIFLFLTIRPDEFAAVTEAVNFVADMERMGLVRRLRLGRFGPLETAELLKRVLARSGRSRVGGGDAGPVRGRPVHRRGARPDPPRGGHAPAGRRRVAARPQRGPARPLGGSDAHRPSRRATPGPDHGRRSATRRSSAGASACATFARSGRGSATATSPRTWPRATCEPGRRRRLARRRPRARRRGRPPAPAARGRRGRLHVHPRAGPPVRREPAHRGSPPPGPRRGRRPAARRRRPALRPACRCSPSTRSRPATPCAPRSSRSMPRPRPSNRTPPRRRSASSTRRFRSSRRPPIGGPSSSTRDDAYAALRKTDERLDGLTELAALAEAMRDPEIELDVQLRRASALRMSHDEDAAAELATRVRDPRRGSGATPPPSFGRTSRSARRCCGPRWASRIGGASPETDLDGAEEAYRRAVELAEQVHDDRSLAAALREIGMIDFARGRAWFAGEVLAGRAGEVLVGGRGGRRHRDAPHASRRSGRC